MATAAQEKLLVDIYNQGIDMRTKFGGSATSAPKFPDKVSSDKYSTLSAEYKRLESIVGAARAKVLTEAKHIAVYGKSSIVKAGIGVGALVLIAAVAAFFVFKKKA